MKTWHDAMEEKPQYKLGTLSDAHAAKLLGQHIIKLFDIKADEPAEKILERVRGIIVASVGHLRSYKGGTHTGNNHKNRIITIADGMTPRKIRNDRLHELVDPLLRAWYPARMHGFISPTLETRLNPNSIRQDKHDFALDYRIKEAFVEDVVAHCSVPAIIEPFSYYRQNGLSKLWKLCVNATTEAIARRLGDEERILAIASVQDRRVAGDIQRNLYVHCGDSDVKTSVIGTLVTGELSRTIGDLESSKENTTVTLSMRGRDCVGSINWLDGDLLVIFDLSKPQSIQESSQGERTHAQ